MSQATPLVVKVNPKSWGSITEVLNAPLIDVPGDATWISIIGMWIFLPINLIQAIFTGLCGCVFVCVSIGTCCIPCSEKCCSAMGSVLAGRPLYLAWTWWRYTLGVLIALVANGRSRLALFQWEWRSFGSGRWWWHLEGVWMWSYEDCNRILKSQQVRQPAFGCVRACIPDMFATNILIFLPNHSSDSEWAAIRRAIHEYFLDGAKESYNSRVMRLPNLVANDWLNPKLTDMNDTMLVNKLVSKCIFFVMFGKWIDDADAEILAGWRSSATYFVLPRIIQRFLFNYLINKVKKLREGSVGIVEKHGLQEVFESMNESLGRWKRKEVVKLCDEIMFVVGFAGIGGTSACVESCAQFLQTKIPKESYAAAINFGDYNTPAKMLAKYKENPDAYILETCRMDPPVTSATTALKEMTTVKLAGREYTLPPGTLNQYVVSMANRDPAVFPEPDIFRPGRTNLTRTLTWNGAAFSADENDYPRICPGRYLSMDIAKTLLNHALGFSTELNADFAKEMGPKTPCC